MDPVVAAAFLSAWGTVVAAWVDTRRRTNGSGPLAGKLDCIEARVVRIEERVVRVEERLS